MVLEFLCEEGVSIDEVSNVYFISILLRQGVIGYFIYSFMRNKTNIEWDDSSVKGRCILPWQSEQNLFKQLLVMKALNCFLQRTVRYINYSRNNN